MIVAPIRMVGKWFLSAEVKGRLDKLFACVDPIYLQFK
jgi:hypothetical protein